MDRSVYPPVVSGLVYQIDGWSGDVLITNFLCFLVTEEAKRVLEVAFSGATFADVEVTISDNFRAVYSDVKLPPFVWLKVNGRAGHDDLGVRNRPFVLSERVVDVLDELGLPFASIEPFDT
jgi:hypothetical protein